MRNRPLLQPKQADLLAEKGLSLVAAETPHQAIEAGAGVLLSLIDEDTGAFYAPANEEQAVLMRMAASAVRSGLPEMDVMKAGKFADVDAARLKLESVVRPLHAIEMIEPWNLIAA